MISWPGNAAALEKTDELISIGELSLDDLYSDCPIVPPSRAPSVEQPVKESDSPKERSENVDIDRKKSKAPRRRLSKQRSWSTEASCEEAWERKCDQRLLEEMGERSVSRAVGRSVSDCGERGRIKKEVVDQPSRLARTRTRSLTDDDLEELRGCIDLGFGFNSTQEDPRLCTTLPALEICYAIARQLQEPADQPSPTSSSDSPSQSPSRSWRISSPGDHPQQVKTRLRHWAQAVACTVRQCC